MAPGQWNYSSVLFLPDFSDGKNIKQKNLMNLARFERTTCVDQHLIKWYDFVHDLPFDLESLRKINIIWHQETVGFLQRATVAPQIHNWNFVNSEYELKTSLTLGRALTEIGAIILSSSMPRTPKHVLDLMEPIRKSVWRTSPDCFPGDRISQCPWKWTFNPRYDSS